MNYLFITGLVSLATSNFNVGAALPGIENLVRDIDTSYLETTFKLPEKTRQDMLNLREVIRTAHNNLDDVSPEICAMGTSKFIQDALLSYPVDTLISENQNSLRSAYENFVINPCEILDDIWFIPRTIYNARKDSKRLVLALKSDKEKFKWLQIAEICHKLLEMRDSTSA